MEPSVEVSIENLAWLADKGGDTEVDARLAIAMLFDPVEPELHALGEASLRRLTEIAPVDSRTWAVALDQHYSALCRAASSAREERPDDPLPLDTRIAIERAIDNGRAADPHNAFWDVADMTLGLAVRDDPRAEAALLRAARGWRFDDGQEKIRLAIHRSAQALSLSDFRAEVAAWEVTWRGSVWASLAARAAACVTLRAYDLERTGSAAEALDMYQAILRLDRLVRAAADDPAYGPRPVGFVARAIWDTRHTVVDPPPDRWKDEDAEEAWESDALEEFMEFAAAHERADLAILAHDAACEWAQLRAATGEREEHEEALLDQLLAASSLWWFQLLVLALIPVLGGAYLAVARAASAIRRHPDDARRRVALGYPILATAVLALLCLAGIHEPMYGLTAESPPTPVNAVASAAAGVVLALAMLASPLILLQCTRERTLRLADRGIATMRIATALCLVAYPLMTFAQAILRAHASGLLR